jgi:hypothetical protein
MPVLISETFSAIMLAGTPKFAEALMPLIPMNKVTISMQTIFFTTLFFISIISFPVDKIILGKI